MTTPAALATFSSLSLINAIWSPFIMIIIIVIVRVIITIIIIIIIIDRQFQ